MLRSMPYTSKNPPPLEIIEGRGKTREELVEIMARLPKCADVTEEEVPGSVSISGISVTEVVNVYALYQKELLKREVVEFSERGRKKMWMSRKGAA